MPRKITLLALALGILLTPVAVASQTATLTGYVRSDAQAPVPGAVVGIPSLDLRTVTNDYGQYLLIVPAEFVDGRQVALVATSIGHQETEETITLNPGTITQNITLPTRAIALDEDARAIGFIPYFDESWIGGEALRQLCIDLGRPVSQP